MRELEKIDLHDAIITQTNLNVALRILEVSIEYYEEEGRNRKTALITFSKVVSTSGLYDLNALQENATAGNVNYWAPKKDGITYIYLVDGCIAVHAQEIEFS